LPIKSQSFPIIKALFGCKDLRRHKDLLQRMNPKEFVRSLIHALKLSHKPSREEFGLYLKSVLLAIAVVGVIGFIIQLIASLLQLSS